MRVACTSASPASNVRASDFDSWYLRNRATGGEFLRGFEHWEAVEGAYCAT